MCLFIDLHIYWFGLNTKNISIFRCPEGSSVSARRAADPRRVSPGCPPPRPSPSFAGGGDFGRGAARRGVRFLYAMLCCAVLCYAMLCYTILYYNIILYYIIQYNIL